MRSDISACQRGALAQLPNQSGPIWLGSTQAVVSWSRDLILALPLAGCVNGGTCRHLSELQSPHSGQFDFPTGEEQYPVCSAWGELQHRGCSISPGFSPLPPLLPWI